MGNPIKKAFLEELARRYGIIRKLENSLSLFEIGNGAARIYIRYSKIHPGKETFYGLRGADLQKLEGFSSFICYLWNEQTEPLFVPFNEYEDIFHSISPASDGQYKAQIFFQDEYTELYVANAGRFNVEAHYGWDGLDSAINREKIRHLPHFTHSGIQTLLGAIGAEKGFEVWIPPDDRGTLDWNQAKKFKCCETLPYAYSTIKEILQEVDVIWMRRGSGELRSLFEIEHTTTIYSGLLRFNDIHLISPSIHPRFSIVSNEERRSLFIKQLNRPTFKASGLFEICSFLDYINVYDWFNRLQSTE